MLFNSVEFLILLPVVFWLYLVSRGRARTWVLLLASWGFYASWEPRFLLLLLFSTALDYVVGQRLEDSDSPGRRRLWLSLSLLGNLGVLTVFKYLPFLLASLGLEGWAEAAETQVFHVEGHIPPGLSFYTFQTLGYTLDVYKRKTKACRNPLDFAVFVAFFPQLVAGPIVRAEALLPQLRAVPTPSVAQVVQGVELFALGLFKKVVVADNIGLWVDAIFADPATSSGPRLLVGAMLFSAQVYADFSGYSTMARGLGSMFGFSLPRNFDYPWLAGDPVGYRRGWHMTLAHWFRDHVYFPLGGSRRGELRASLNLLIVWMLFGLWHGAAWTFIAWGAYNGIVQVLYRAALRRGVRLPDFPGKPLVGVLGVALFITPAMVLFRTTTLHDGLLAMGRIFTVRLDGEGPPPEAMWLLVGLLGVHALSKRFYDENLLVRLPVPARWVLLGGVALAAVLLAPAERPFIYFQF